MLRICYFSLKERVLKILRLSFKHVNMTCLVYLIFYLA